MTNYLMTKTQKAKLKEAELQDWKPSEKGNSIVYDKRIGRNTKCPCGSNKKYKNCCKEN